jgi:hypothetical protein
MRSTMPAFGQFQQEAAVIGRLLAGYGELEYELMVCLSCAIGDIDTAVRVVFRARGEEQRIIAADTIMRPWYDAVGLINPYSEAVADMGWCRQIRNQYAHCHWITIDNGLNLGFYDLEAAAKSNTKIRLKRHEVDLALLQEQESYFCYVNECFWYLDHEFQSLSGQLKGQPFRLPPKVPRPLKYNATP